MRVVLDTSVLVAAVKSRRGASYALVQLIPAGKFQPALSVGLYLEWLEVLSRPEHRPPGKSPADVQRFLRSLARHAHLQEIYFLWRPFLADADDDLVLELAFAAHSRYLVTHNVKDFRGADQLGITVLTPGEFLKRLENHS